MRGQSHVRPEARRARAQNRKRKAGNHKRAHGLQNGFCGNAFPCREIGPDNWIQLSGPISRRSSYPARFPGCICSTTEKRSHTPGLRSVRTGTGGGPTRSLNCMPKALEIELKRDFGISDRCKREYRPNRTWVQAGKPKWPVCSHIFLERKKVWVHSNRGPRGAAPLSWYHQQVTLYNIS
jgi:hypothetical protein